MACDGSSRPVLPRGHGGQRARAAAESARSPGGADPRALGSRGRRGSEVTAAAHAVSGGSRVCVLAWWEGPGGRLNKDTEPITRALPSCPQQPPFCYHRLEGGG